MLHRFIVFCLCLCVTFPTAIKATFADDYSPKIADKSDEGQMALQTFTLPEGMQGKLAAAEPAIANPVAFTVADDGSIYVCETFRQQHGVEDNRSHMNWLMNDLRLESVEERLVMFKQFLGHDVEKYAAEHDRIRLLKDEDQDGVFEKDTVFADGFNDILDGTGAGVLEVDGNVFYTCIPKVWSLTDSDGDGIADRRKALHHGYGIRVAFRGHDMHGLVRGPDGRVYFSIGDRGYNVITPEGKRLKKVDTGAVFRCDADGANLEVFAHGLRNPQELAFDNDGNLWTGDNNSDGGDQARWVYIVQDGDTGWRMYFQYEADRGPWNRERMWYPYRIDEQTTAVQPAYIVPPIANLGDGPSGLTYYPGVGLNHRYDNHFFMADFRGGASNSGIRSFSVEPKGATFELTDSHQFIWQILATDIDFAADGGLYATDWVNGWNGEGKGRLYHFSDTNYSKDAIAAQVPTLLASGIKAASDQELATLLDHVDRRVRQKVQFEMVKRNLKSELIAIASSEESRIASRQAAWGLWQVGLQDIKDAPMVGEWCANTIDGSPNQADQAVRILTDLARRHGAKAIFTSEQQATLTASLKKAIIGSDRRLAGFSAVALGTFGRANDCSALVDLLVVNQDQDPVLRHQATMGLLKLATKSPNSIEPIVNHESAIVRRNAAVLCRRLNDTASLLQLVQDADADVRLEACRALIDEHSSSADTAVMNLSQTSLQQPAMLRRCLEAAYRVGTTEAAKIVATVAINSKVNPDVQAVAVDLLSTWNSPKQTNSVNGMYRELPSRDVLGLDEVVSGVLPQLLAGTKKTRKIAIKMAADLGIESVVPQLSKILDNDQASAADRVASFRALIALTAKPKELLQKGLKSELEEIRVAALSELSKSQPEIAIPELLTIAQQGATVSRQKAISLLGGIKSKSAVAAQETLFADLAQDNLPNSVILELLKAAKASQAGSLTKMVAAYRQKQQEVGTEVAKWSECLEGGDVGRGYNVFFGRAAASCRRCHKVNGDGADVGPDLSAIAKTKDRTYLLEAIVDPNKAIAKGFETTIIIDMNGKTLSGIIRDETDKMIKMVTAQGAILTIAVDDIDERFSGQSGMPGDLAKNLSRDDLRDLVAYLSTLKSNDAGQHGEGE
ncbi:MAG: PVC-type heme-binding CxxCH protein [Fuerstiella sp.]